MAQNGEAVGGEEGQVTVPLRASLSSETALALVHEVKGLSTKLDESKVRLRELEGEIRRKDACARSLREESALLRDLCTINELSLRKSKYDSQVRRKKITVDEATVQQIMSLEAQIKQEQAEGQRLAAARELTAEAMRRTEQDVARYQEEIENVKRCTGYVSNKGLNYVDERNRFKENQRTLSRLDEAQEAVRRETTTLTNRIEELSRELETRKQIDEEVIKAKCLLNESQEKLRQLREDTALYSRISSKKSRLIATASKSVDQRSKIKALEGDKRALHNELSKLEGQRKTSEKTIAAQAVRIKHLDIRLGELQTLLKQLFASNEESTPFRQGLDADATSAPLEQVAGLQRGIEVSRRALEARSEAIQQLDVAIETSDRKTVVLHNAMNTRMANASHAIQQLERDYILLKSHMEEMQRDFNMDYEKLEDSNSKLRALLSSAGREPCA